MLTEKPALYELSTRKAVSCTLLARFTATTAELEKARCRSIIGSALVSAEISDGQMDTREQCDCCRSERTVHLPDCPVSTSLETWSIDAELLAAL